MARAVSPRGKKVRFHSLVRLEGTNSTPTRRCRAEVRGGACGSASNSAEVSSLLGQWWGGEGLWPPGCCKRSSRFPLVIWAQERVTSEHEIRVDPVPKPPLRSAVLWIVAKGLVSIGILVGHGPGVKLKEGVLAKTSALGIWDKNHTSEVSSLGASWPDEDFSNGSFRCSAMQRTRAYPDLQDYLDTAGSLLVSFKAFPSSLS